MLLCDGSTDSAVVEKESIYILFVDPDMFQPTLSFLYLKGLPSEDADVIVKAIKSTFSIHDLHHLLQKMVFIASDGAIVNSGVKGGIATNFREEEQFGIFFIDLNLQYLTACMSIYCPSNNVYIISSICMKNLAKN